MATCVCSVLVRQTPYRKRGQLCTGVFGINNFWNQLCMPNALQWQLTHVKWMLRAKVQWAERPSAPELHRGTATTTPEQPEARSDVSLIPCCNQLFASHTPSAGCPLTLARKLSIFFPPREEQFNLSAVQADTSGHQPHYPNLPPVLTLMDSLSMVSVSTLTGKQHHFCNRPQSLFSLKTPVFSTTYQDTIHSLQWVLKHAYFHNTAVPLEFL